MMRVERNIFNGKYEVVDDDGKVVYSSFYESACLAWIFNNE